MLDFVGADCANFGCVNRLLGIKSELEISELFESTNIFAGLNSLL